MLGVLVGVSCCFGCVVYGLVVLCCVVFCCEVSCCVLLCGRVLHCVCVFVCLFACVFLFVCVCKSECVRVCVCVCLFVSVGGVCTSALWVVTEPPLPVLIVVRFPLCAGWASNYQHLVLQRNLTP